MVEKAGAGGRRKGKSMNLKGDLVTINRKAREEARRRDREALELYRAGLISLSTIEKMRKLWIDLVSRKERDWI